MKQLLEKANALALRTYEEMRSFTLTGKTQNMLDRLKEMKEQMGPKDWEKFADCYRTTMQKADELPGAKCVFMHDKDELLGKIENCMEIVPDDCSRKFLDGVHMRYSGLFEMKLVATDGHRLLEYTIKTIDDRSTMPRVLIPKSALKQLRALKKVKGDLYVTVDDKLITFEVKGPDAYASVTMESVSGFPHRYDRVFIETDKVVKFVKSEYQAAAERLWNLQPFHKTKAGKLRKGVVPFIVHTIGGKNGVKDGIVKMDFRVHIEPYSSVGKDMKKYNYPQNRLVKSGGVHAETNKGELEASISYDYIAPPFFNSAEIEMHYVDDSNPIIFKTPGDAPDTRYVVMTRRYKK